MTSIELDMMQTMAVGILTLLLGMFLNKKSGFLRGICIPAPVTGGIIFSLITLAIYSIWGLEVKFDATLKDICMVVFFTTVGYQSNLTVIKEGGRPLAIIVALIAVLIACQDLIGVGIAEGLGISPLLGLSAGSITMCGGHGTGAGFSPLLESMGLDAAASVTMAAATFGLLGGSLLGGPLAERIIRRKGLAASATADAAASETLSSNDAIEEAAKEVAAREAVETTVSAVDEQGSTSGYAKAAYEIFIAAGIGTLLNKLLALTGISFPTYFGALIVAAIIRNVSELVPNCPKTAIDEISSIGGISLSLFLGMAMVTLRLWELSGLALPLVIILCAQILFMFIFGRFIAFPLLGRDYDAAVLVSGVCGFGLGATPNAMANMSAVCSKYRYSAMPFIVVPVVGAMFVDIINIGIITLFLNLI